MRSPVISIAVLCLSSTALIAAAPAPPAAATADSSADDNAGDRPVFYETTTVTARPVSSASGAVTVLDSREIEASAARSLTDMVRDVPGMNALSSGGRAGVSNAFIRGADPNYTLVLLDGIPLNDATELQGGAVNLEELPAELVERAEIVRGPLTSFYGTNALAGVVQLFTGRGGPGPVRFDSGVEAGNADLRHGFAKLAGGAGTSGGYAAGGSWAEEQHRVGQDRFRQLDLWGSGDLRLGTRAALGLTGRFADGEADDYPDASGGPVYGTGELRHGDHQDLAIGARLDLGEAGSPRHRVFIGLSRRELDRTSPAVPPVVPESIEQTTYTRLRAAWQVPLLRGPHTQLDAGLSGEGEWGRNTSVLRLPDFMGGDVPGDYSKDRATVGAFAGVRHERAALLYEAALRLDQASGDSLQANPHAGVVFRPGKRETRLRVSGGRASKMPSFFALASPRALGGNPALEPEHVWAGEAGVEHRLSAARLDVGATYFRSQYSNLVDFDFEQFLHVNRARVRMQGFELTARWQPHRTVSLEGEATYLHVVDLAGGTLLHTPRWTGGGRLTWQPLPQLDLRLHGRGSSHYLDVQYPVPDRDTVDGDGLLGAALSWRFANGLVLRGRADNLTNASYETLIGFPGPARSYWAGVGWQRR